MSFKALGLSENLLKAIEEAGYHKPTSIQKSAIPAILKKQDVAASAKTGTGKTAAFVLPTLALLSASDVSQKKYPIRALVLTPTRELAAQVLNNVQVYGKYTSLKSTAVFGGVKISPQISKLRSRIDILVATPGRLLDLLGQKALHLSSIEILILDEADRMLNMGFINDIRKILALLPKQRQNLLFSATFSSDIRMLAQKMMQNPLWIEIETPGVTADGITQVIHPVDRNRKAELLSALIRKESWDQALVFTRTKHGADQLTKKLNEDGIVAIAIHSDKSQYNRTKALTDFKKGKTRILVATDIAARGLDIHKLSHVVNFDLPDVPEDYIHRIGRTGRAKNTGAAISLVCADEKKLLHSIEKTLNQKIPQIVIPDSEPKAKAKKPISTVKPVKKKRFTRFR